MSTASPSVKQRKKNKATTSTPDGVTNGNVEAYLEKAQAKVETAVKSEWEFKLALGVITILAFVTRFYGISHPNQVVFDEVHFGKVGSQWKSCIARAGADIYYHSLLPTTCKEHTSSTYIPHSASSSSHWQVGSWVTRATFFSRTLETRTLQTKCHMLHIGPCRR